MKNSVYYSIIFFPLFIIVAIVSIITLFGYKNLKAVEEIYSSKFLEEYNQNNKNSVMNKIESIYGSINYNIKSIEDILESNLQDKLEIALKIVEDTYQSNKSSLNQEQIISLVIEKISQLRFDNNEGYFFIFDTRTNILISHPKKEFKGMDFTNFQDVQGKNLLLFLKKDLETQKFAFEKIYLEKPSDNVAHPKLDGAFEFKPLNLIIGTGEYLDTIEKSLQEQEISKLKTISKDKEIKVNIFTFDENSKFKNLINETVISEELNKILQDVLVDETGFYIYKENNKDKYSYFFYVSEWKWVMECGFYVDKVNSIINVIKSEINQILSKIENNTVLILSLIVIFTLFSSTIILNKIRNIIFSYTNRIKEYIKIVDENVITSSTDLNGNIIYASKAFCEISGYTQDELIGQKHSIIKHGDINKKVFEDLWKTILNNGTWKGELKNKKKDGEYYWVEATIQPIYKNSKKVGYTAIRHDITSKKMLEKISITDGLTSLYNRRYFNDIFPKSLNIAKRDNKLFAFILMDVDFFKQYNDTYGHQRGDEVLVEISKTLKNCLKRADDLVFRLGGEEFGILFNVDDKEKALIFADNIKNEIENLKILHSKNSTNDYVTVSMGLICNNASNLSTIDEVYQMADELLYKSKNDGRNRISMN